METAARLTCPACDGASTLLFETDYRHLIPFLSAYYGRDVAAEGTYSIRECAACATLFQGEMADSATLSELYDEWIGEAHEAINERDLGELRLAARFLGKPVLRTLDFGMGAGAWARAAKLLGHHSYGYDLAESRMREARTHGIETGDGRDFDFINCEQVFEHLGDPLKVMNDLSGRLAPGGVLKISVPSQRGVRRAIRRLRDGETMDRWIDPLHPLEHVNNFSRAGLIGMARRFSLQPVRPGLALQFATTGKSGKEWLRPLHRWWNPGNNYFWFRAAQARPAEGRG